MKVQIINNYRNLKNRSENITTNSKSNMTKVNLANKPDSVYFGNQITKSSFIPMSTQLIKLFDKANNKITKIHIIDKKNNRLQDTIFLYADKGSEKIRLNRYASERPNDFSLVVTTPKKEEMVVSLFTDGKMQLKKYELDENGVPITDPINLKNLECTSKEEIDTINKDVYAYLSKTC